MKLKSILAIFVIILIFQNLGTSQTIEHKQILEESKSDLVIVGRIESYSRNYNNKTSGNLDTTFASFRVLRILKGNYKQKYIEVRFPDHLAFSSKPYTILFITTDMKAVAGDRKLGNCLESTCYYSIFDWTLANSKKNLATVKNLLQPKQNF